MHIEINVAVNYVMSQLYEKLPRRRVNIFGEELEKALKEKFDGHWYPEASEKGSGYRCLKVGRANDPPDPLLEKAAFESGIDVHNILEYLPKELNVWIDPGEVSFRIGDKGPAEILFSMAAEAAAAVSVAAIVNGGSAANNAAGISVVGAGADSNNNNSDTEVARTFNPEAKCFRPNDFGTAPSVAAAAAINAHQTYNSLAISKPSGSPCSGGSLSPVGAINMGPMSAINSMNSLNNMHSAVAAAVAAGNKCGSPPSHMNKAPSMCYGGKNGKAITPNHSMHVFPPRTNTPTFTTATFAQTKFGSTKLKTNSKRNNRSPTEFANYIKQRAQQLQQMQIHGGQPVGAGNAAAISPPQMRSYGDAPHNNNFYSPHNHTNHSNFSGGAYRGSNNCNNLMDNMGGAFNMLPGAVNDTSMSRFNAFMDDVASPPYFNQTLGPLSPINTSGPSLMSTKSAAAMGSSGSGMIGGGAFDKNYIDNLNFALNSPGPSSPYQQLLLAN